MQDTCPCDPSKLYKGGPPVWNAPTGASEAACAASMMGMRDYDDLCNEFCHEIPNPCYAYALNISNGSSWMYPGARHSTSDIPRTIKSCEDLDAAVVSDGARIVSTIGSESHVFAGYMGPSEGEYHFARRDNDTGTWSSKNGDGKPLQVDSDGKVITDATAAHFNLNGDDLKFCSYYAVGSADDVCPSADDCVAPQPGKGKKQSAFPGCGLPGP